MVSDDAKSQIQQSLVGEELTHPTCKPPHFPDRTCENEVARVITVYYNVGPVNETIEWRVCDDHAEEVRNTGDAGEVREDREYIETRDGFADGNGGGRRA